MRSEDVIKTFGDCCPGCEKETIVICEINNLYELRCTSCGLILFTSGLSRDDETNDIIFSELCDECMEYGVRYKVEDEAVVCNYCGEVFFR